MRYFFISSTLLALCFAFLLTSCECIIADAIEDRPNELPPITSEGLNTFGCMVNDEVWYAWDAPRPFLSNNEPDSVRAIGDSTSFQLQAYADYFPILEEIEIQLFLPQGEVIRPGIRYSFSGIGRIDSLTQELQTHATGTGRNCFFGGEKLPSEGWVTFSRYDSLDRRNGIAAGEFEFSMQGFTSSCGECIVTQGRFDVLFSR